MSQRMSESGCRLQTADLYRYSWVSDARIAPDGAWVAFVHTHVDREEDEYVSRIRVVSTETGEMGEFTRGNRDYHPRWSPDGRRLAFLSQRGDGEAQIWIMPFAGGEPRRLTEQDGGVRSFAWAPEGDRLAYVASLSEGELSAGTEEEQEDGVRIIRKMRYKLNGAGFIHDKYTHVFVVGADGTSDARRITDGPYDHTEPAWDPAGEYVACITVRCADPDYVDYSDVYFFPADGSVPEVGAEPVRVTESEGPCSMPVLCGPGESMFYVGHGNEFFGATEPTLLSVSPLAGGAEDLLPDFDAGVGNAVGGDCRYGSGAQKPVPTADGERVYFLSTSLGACNLYRLDANGSGVTAVTEEPWVITEFSYSDEAQRFALVAETVHRPGDIWTYSEEEGLQQLTAVNEWLDRYHLSSYDEIEFAGAEGAAIQGWVLHPSVEDRKDEHGEYPAILQIHGGPHAAYGYGYYHEFHVMAAEGYGILYVNPHGSRGYGQEFTAATRCDWGGKDYQDLMRAVDHTVREFSYSPGRLGVTGGSFGGFMTNWIVTRTDRFRAAVTQRSSSNRYSMFGTSDIGFNHGKYEFPGHPWDDPMGYLERSPINYVDNVETPILIMHAEEDLRCPISQAEEWFVALKRLQKEAVFVRFAGENHELSRSGTPRLRLRRLDFIMDWFDDYAL